MKEVIAHYHIASSVQRHFLNLSMTNVTLEVEVVDIDFFRKFTDDVNVIVKIYGLKGGRTWIDDRTIKLHRNNKNGKLLKFYQKVSIAINSSIELISSILIRYHHPFLTVKTQSPRL